MSVSIAIPRNGWIVAVPKVNKKVYYE